MKQFLPCVSICICTYNQASYLEQAIRSAFDQTWPAIEVIVSDDCSTDSTPLILKRLSAELPLLKVIRQPKNLGIAQNTDVCMRLATGELIVRLDSDDYLFPTYVEKLSELLIKNPLAGYAHADVQEVNEAGAFLNRRKLFRPSGFQSAANALKTSIKGYKVTANIIMFRREALIKVGYVTGRPNFGEDYHLTASISAAGFGNVYLDEKLAFYRLWTDAGKLRQRRKLAEINGICRVFEDVIEPAYKVRGWSLNEVKTNKTNFACQHANCLGWKIYNAQEKQEIIVELSKLSTAGRVKIAVWIYSNGLGSAIVLIDNLKANIKSAVKAMFMILDGKR